MAAPEGHADQLALTMVNGLTAFLLLEDYARAQPGEWIIQNGVSVFSPWIARSVI